jgi:hypothetical protein
MTPKEELNPRLMIIIIKKFFQVRKHQSVGDGSELFSKRNNTLAHSSFDGGARLRL